MQTNIDFQPFEGLLIEICLTFHLKVNLTNLYDNLSIFLNIF